METNPTAYTQRRIPIGLLLAWLCCFTIGIGLLAQYLPRGQAEIYKSKKKKSLAIAQDLSRDFQGLSNACDTMAARLQANPKAGFPTFLSITPHSLYLFRDTSLAFWSHSNWVPTYSLVLGSTYKIVTDNSGVALVACKQFKLKDDERHWYAMARQPLYNKYPVSNAYLKSGWVKPSLQGVKFYSLLNEPESEIVYLNKKPIVAFLLPALAPPAHADSGSGLYIGLVLVLFSLLAGAGWGAAMLADKGYYLAALGAWAGALMSVKAVMYLDFVRPALTASPLFAGVAGVLGLADSTLGDFLITCVLLALFWGFVFRYFFRARWSATLRQWPFAAGFVFTAAHMLALLMVYRAIKSIYLYTPFSLDIAHGFESTPPKLGALATFLVLAIVLFFCLHVIARMLTRVAQEEPKRLFLGMAAGATAVLGYMALVHSHAWYVQGVGLIILLAWIFLRLPEYLFRLRYQTYFYFFSMAILASATATQAYVRYREIDSYRERDRFARRLVNQGDPLAESLLAEMGTRVKSDTVLPSLLAGAADASSAEERVRSLYIDPYFNSYVLDLGFFDAKGRLQLGQSEMGTLKSMAAFLQANMVPTSFKDIFFAHMPSDEIFKRYIYLIKLASGPIIVVDLKMRRLNETSVFATLLVNGSGLAPERAGHFSYAVYDTTGIRVQDGPYNYERGFSPTWLQQRTPMETHQKAGWIHALFRQPDGQQLVVSAPDTTLRDAFTNFSFLLLVLVSVILAIVVGYTLRQQVVHRSLTFAGKIQIYLNAAFFLPLTVFGLVSFTLVEISLRADLNAGYLQRARNAAKSLEAVVEQYQAGQLRQQQFYQKLEDMARIAGLNTSLYANNGHLLFSSHPLIYRKKLLSTFINPEALTLLADEGLHETLLDENLGRLHYSTAYVAVRVPKTQKIAALLAVPFFEAGSELEAQLSNALSTVVSSFTAVFIVFMVLSYFASQLLIVPLKLITSRIKRTTLGENEPLKWTSKDEIGMLVEGYNGMLRKLEASRAALATSEKESAWREMAQQVAHEIKNPLTPMKLTVQQLQRVLSPEAPAPDVAKLQRPLAGLLEQIENLSDIAGSFSAFARMPQPKSALFDLARVVRRTTELHKAGSGAAIQIVVPDLPAATYILGDEGIFQGIINNLIINGLQAVPPTRQAVLHVELVRLAGNELRLSVQDNGDGIPHEIQSKVFLPNFSTKFSGSGIGLALAKRGVEHAHGKIWFDTNPEAGTTFYIEVAEQV